MKNRFLIIAVFMSVLGGLHSQNVIRPKIACPNNIWVNSYNGVLFYQRVDLSIPNRNMPLEAVFYYNSSSNASNYGYGNGWSLGYEYRYIVDSLGIIIETGDGRQDLYSGTNLEAPAGVFSTLAELPSGGYALSTKEGTVYTFADTVSKRITQLRDRNNNVLNFAYNDGNLSAISDISGRSITMTWTDGLLSTLGTNIDDRQWQYAYDTVGNLISVTNPMNYTVHYGYNRDNRISRFTDEAGYSTLVTYNDDGMAHRIKTDLTDKSIRYEQSSRQTVIVDYLEDGNNQFTTYRWDTLGRVIEKTGNCCGYTSKLEYDEDNNVVRSEDANGNVTTCTYDGNGNMLTLTDPLGNTENYTYTTDGYNNIATYSDKLEHQYTFSYDSEGNLIAINGPLGSTTQYTYDSYGQVLTQTDAMNHTTTMGYDTYGNLTSVTDALGNVSTISYDAFGNPVTQTSPMGATQHHTYDRLNRLTSSLDAIGNRTILTLDSRGNLTTVTNALQQSTHISYDALGQPISATDARQATTAYTYNAKGKPVEVRNALNHATRLFYDDRDRMTLTIDALGDSTRYQYDAAGNMTNVSLPNGQEITYTYDALDRLIQTADQYGVMQTTLYDAMGNVAATVNANGDTTRMTYDALGRLTQTTDPMGHSEQYGYDLSGNLLTHTDANGNTTTYTYNAVGNLLTETDAMNNVTTYTYNADGSLTSVTDANGNTTAYTYDAAGRLSVITFANGKTQQFWYDAVGNTVKQKDESGNITLMAYDAAGKLLSRTYPDGSSDQYTYDLLGNMLTANNATANITFTYDANGQVLSEQMQSPLNSQFSILNYEYDTRQGKINITYPSGRAIEERYDLRGRLSNIVSDNDTIAVFTYFPTDYIASRTYGNGDVSTFSYDAANRLSSIQSINSNQSILSLNYSYDFVGNILSKTDAIRLDRSETYGYDALHRLIEFRRGVADNSGVIPNPLKQVQYNMDALGNRISVTTDGTTTAYAHNNTNAYTTVGSETMQYDGNGNMLSDGRHTYQYNYRNRMISVDNGTTATYQYDALDRRISKTTATDTIHYYYRGVQCIEEFNVPSMREGASSNIPSWEGQGWVSYVYGSSIDNILSMHRNSQDYYYHKNHLGSVMAITDSTGAIVETYDYDPYGAPTIYDSAGSEMAVSTIGNTILFTCREYDYETSLYYYRARTMHPAFGRFMQHDPLGYVDGYNDYLFVNGNPIINNDPLGFIASGDCGICNIPPSVKKIIETNKDIEKGKFIKTINIVSNIPGTIDKLILLGDNNKIQWVQWGWHNNKIGSWIRGGRGYKRLYNTDGWITLSQKFRVIRKIARVFDVYSKITHVTTYTKTIITDFCNGYTTVETAKVLFDIIADYNIYAGTLDFGYTIGELLEEKWHFGQNAWDFYGMDDKMEKWGINDLRERFEDWNYDRKYGKYGMLK